MGRKLRITLVATAIVAVAVGVVVLYRYNPTDVGFYPRCPSKMLTGYDCPGCGSLRGLHALLHGDFAAAWSFNPALYLALALIAVIAIAGIHRRPLTARNAGRRITALSRRVAALTDHPAFPLTILAATLAWTIVRNL